MGVAATAEGNDPGAFSAPAWVDRSIAVQIGRNSDFKGPGVRRRTLYGDRSRRVPAVRGKLCECAGNCNVGSDSLGTTGC